MPKSTIAKRRKNRLTREEKAQVTYSRLMDGAAKVIGRDGYAAATIAKITSEAGIAQGTFYNYFEDRQELFDTLLPHVGQQMLDYIRDAMAASVLGADREVARFKAFCDYLSENPGFYRLLYEAEVFSPPAFAKHIRSLVEGYRNAFRRAEERREIGHYSDDELEVVIFILLGARAYVSMQFIAGVGEQTGDRLVPDAAVEIYGKLIRHGLFRGGGSDP